MAWYDKIAEAVLIDPNKGDEAAKPAAPAPVMQPIGGSVALAGSAYATPQVSPEFVAAIRKVVLSRNTALTQLLTAADKLASIIPDPVTRFKAAFATAGDGRTTRQVAEAVDIHLADVDGEEARFKQAIDKKAAEEVGGQERRAAAATSAITSNTQQIEQLQARIAELSAQIGTFQQDVAQATAEAATKRLEIEQATAQFKMAAQVVKQELQSHKSTILSALG
jgi:chromosome segregation ATPase